MGEILLASAAGVIAAFAACEAAPAQAPRTIELTGAQGAAVAVPLLLQSAQWNEALAVLDTLPPEARANPLFLYMRATALRGLGQHGRAIEIYQRLLTQRADLAQVRFELARALFDAGDEAAAEQNFRLALAGMLSEAERNAANAYLVEIARRHRWRVQTSFSLAPDSNLNAATDLRQVRLFGLPFTLSEEARRVSGFSITGAFAADRAFQLSPDRALRVTALASLRDAEGGDFDLWSGEARIGPQFGRGQKYLSAQAAWQRYWYGGDELLSAPGLVAEYAAPTSRDVVWSFFASAYARDYAHADEMDGASAQLGASRTHFLSPKRFWRVSLSIAGADAEAASNAYVGQEAALGLYQALPAGFSVFLEGGGSHREYQARSPLFGVRRRDDEIYVTARLGQRSFNIRGFTPYLGAEYRKSRSDISLYGYDRARFEVGFARDF
ncbi:MAG: surface lipoprotein assembly modifier [Hyphomonadaceae bacterium]